MALSDHRDGAGSLAVLDVVALVATVTPSGRQVRVSPLSKATPRKCQKSRVDGTAATAVARTRGTGH